MSNKVKEYFDSTNAKNVTVDDVLPQPRSLNLPKITTRFHRQIISIKKNLAMKFTARMLFIGAFLVNIGRFRFAGLPVCRFHKALQVFKS